MKKVLFACLLSLALFLCACGHAGSDDNNIIKVTVTVFPEYDWVREIARGVDNVEITLLLDNGVDMHSYQPTADDMIKIAGSDIFLYVGGESEKWTEDAITERTNKNMKTLSLIDTLGDAVKKETAVEGMQADTEEEEEYDEHVWLSVRNAKTFCRAIADTFCEADPANAAVYKANLEKYSAELDRLDAEYEAAADLEGGHGLMLFGDRFPFRYLADDYGISYYAAFPGCSAESEASFETIVFLAGKIDEYKLKTVFVLENSDSKIAQTIIDTSTAGDCEIAVLDSLQSTTESEIAEGKTYISVMEKNLEVLRKAFGW